MLSREHEAERLERLAQEQASDFWDVTLRTSCRSREQVRPGPSETPDADAVESASTSRRVTSAAVIGSQWLGRSSTYWPPKSWAIMTAGRRTSAFSAAFVGRRRFPPKWLEDAEVCDLDGQVRDLAKAQGFVSLRARSSFTSADFV